MLSSAQQQRSNVYDQFSPQHCEISQQEQKLQEETSSNVAQDHKRDHSERGDNAQFITIGTAYKVVYLLVLISLMCYIFTQIIIQQRTSLKYSDKYLQNLEQLKKNSQKGNEQKDEISRFKLKNFETAYESKQKQKREKMGATQQNTKPQINRLKTKKISNVESLINFQNDGSEKHEARTKKQNNLNSYEGPNSASEAMKSQYQRSGMNTMQRRVFGAGISQDQIQKAQLRKELVQLPFQQSNQVSKEEVSYYEQKYRIGSYTELPFCIVVPTYNNAQNNRYLNNIRSIVMQNYTNYHLVVIDDASNDQTGTLILDFLQSQKVLPKERYEVIRNSERMRAMHNLRFAAKNYCKPDDIFMIVDGDDELLGRQVLKLFNAKFQAGGLYFMYTNFLSISGKAGYSRPFPKRIIEENGYRKYPFITSHLRAFYTQLFLNLRDEDLQDDNGDFFKAANDVAICIPILEQAHTRIQYVPELTYFYNANTGLNNHALRLKEQRSNDKKVRTKSKYNEVDHLFEKK